MINSRGRRVERTLRYDHDLSLAVKADQLKKNMSGDMINLRKISSVQVGDE